MLHAEQIRAIYKDAKCYLSMVPKNDLNCEKNLLHIINSLSPKKDLTLFDENDFNIAIATDLFRNFEEEIKKSFDEKDVYFLLFKNYALMLDVFSLLCIYIATKKEKKDNVKFIIEEVKESVNLLKYNLPLDELRLQTLNNIVGKQLYYLTHINYVDITSKHIDYIFDEYHMYLEKQIHGFELSITSNFGNDINIEKTLEESILLNNSSFLLLKMIHKIQHFKSHINYEENKKLQEIKYLFYKISHQEVKDSKLKEFHDDVLNIFLKSAKTLENKINYKIIDEKIKLLSFNTDEYKELVDIIIATNAENKIGLK